MSDPILLFLTVDTVTLILLGTFGGALPPAAGGFLATGLSGLGALLCLPPLLMRTTATALKLPAGPPGLSLHLTLDPLSAFFLIIVFLAGTAIAAFQATTPPRPLADSVRTTALCLAGAVLSLLAADGVTLAIGLTVAVGGVRTSRGPRAGLLIPLILLAAVCLLAPAGFDTAFDVIRAGPVDSGRATAAAVLTIAGVAGLCLCRPGGCSPKRDTLSAGLPIALGSYLLLRLLADLSGAAMPAWCGFVLMLGGGAMAVVQGWGSASHPDIDGCVRHLAQWQGGVAVAGIGLALIARSADLPGGASAALAATFLSAIASSVAGMLASLSAHAIGDSAGTYRLSRLGGLVHAMPGTSAALAVGLLGLSAIPPGVGFASLWLLFQAILSAPRTGGLLIQLPLALIGAGLALSAALAAAGSVRLIGIAILGRPRTPRGAGAREATSRPVLLVLAGVSMLTGLVPGPSLWLLAGPAIRGFTGDHAGLAWVSPSSAAPGYLPLPVLALLALATGAAMLAPRWRAKETKTAGTWTDGMVPPVGLPFGEPAAQSVGQGFLPVLPAIALPRLPRLPAVRPPRPPSAVAGLWLILAAFGSLLLVLAVTT